MNSSKNVIGILVIGALLSLLLYQCNINKGQAKELADRPIIHDTVTTKEPFFIDSSIIGSTKVIPTHVIFHDTIPWYTYGGVKYDTTKKLVIVTKDSIVWDTISIAFLTQYQKTPRLLMGKFGVNYLTLDLQQPSGIVVEKNYTLDYSKHKYEYFEGELRSYDTLTLPFWKLFTDESYLTTTYNPVYKGSDMRVDYSFMFRGVIGATAFLNFSTYQSPNFSGGIGPRA